VYLCLGVVGGVYALAAYAMNTHWGVDQIAAVAQQQGPGTLFGMATGFLCLAAQALYLSSLFAAMLAFQEYFCRYLAGLAQAGVLPAVFARRNRYQSAWVASLLLSAVGAVVIAGYALAHLDPLVELFFWVVTTGGYGILCLMVVTSVAVMVFFARHRAAIPAGIGTRVLAPGFAAIALGVMAWIATVHYEILLGWRPARYRLSRSPLGTWWSPRSGPAGRCGCAGGAPGCTRPSAGRRPPKRCSRWRRPTRRASTAPHRS